ncbi:hypothetical protein [Sphingopyxis sp. KK2]|uniref:hypothetical protein n=1 Tax=Sphingopyxis sp. KK2 TaxID=1855727 RepID=UPI00097E60F6|nr:hypothetical protein [Sphingopyxis sp. KK2]
MLRLAAAALMLTAASPVAAAEPDACTAPADLAATPYAAWTGADGDAATLAIGTPVTLPLADGAASRVLTIDTAGRYGVAAGSKVWIDLVTNGTAQTSVEHGHGPACSGIRKIVWFDLKPGTYELALTKGEAASVRVLVVRAP